MSPDNRHGMLFNVCAAILLIGLLVVMGLLIRQNLALKAQLAEMQSEPTDAPRLKVGDVVDPFSLPALDGTMTRVDFSAPDSETVLFFFSPDCPACDSNFENWVAIEQLQRLEKRRLVFISAVPEEETRMYVTGLELESEVLIADRSVLESYKVFHIPATVQIRAGGEVSGVWLGILSDSVVSELY